MLEKYGEGTGLMEDNKDSGDEYNIADDDEHHL